ncbi:hypothetical protein ACFWDI_01700 [Streptomyces sp. NPDC060064]|uniref:hypothetical protein n=1 Tax=Streptomyces sp. NPDC060064 TaxID=3347049 RepID=UPI0036BC3831
MPSPLSANQVPPPSTSRPATAAPMMAPGLPVKKPEPPPGGVGPPAYCGWVE